MNPFEYIKQRITDIADVNVAINGRDPSWGYSDLMELLSNIEEAYNDKFGNSEQLPSIQSNQQTIAGQKSDLIHRETARRIIDSPRSKSQMLTVLRCMPSAQPDRSLWFRIGEVCVNESKGDITAEVAIEKIRALLKAETIYCKDCKYRGSFNYCTYKTRAGWITRDNGHCSEAERLEKGGE